jgi:glucose/arabinose dehydrogenase
MVPMLPPRRLLMACVLGVVLAACSEPSPPRSPSPSVGPPSGAPAPASERAAPTERGTVRPSASATGVAIATEPPALALEEVVNGLSAPINIAATPDGWLLVNERAGRVVAVDPTSGERAVTLDIGDRVLGQGEQGLLGLALHPDWPDAPRAFMHYSDRNGDTVLAEYAATATAAPPVLDPTSERVILRADQPFANHNGGQLAFGPDGSLYIALGDGGSGGDPQGHGQNPHSLLGSILRIDVEMPDDTPAPDSIGYGIPDDNPFADGADGAPEVFVYGLRNPWRFSFDAATGALWIGDVGQNAYEEVDRLDPEADAGANLGWNVKEASHCYNGLTCASDGLVLPIAEYGRDQGCSVSGGYVYRGDAIPGLTGWYLFSDYCSGLVFGVPSDVEGVVAPRVLLETGRSVSTFGQDADGELYVADLGGGAIYRIVAGG